MTGTHTDTIDPLTGQTVTFASKTKVPTLTLSDIGGQIPNQIHNYRTSSPQKKDQVMFYEDFETYTAGDYIHNAGYSGQSSPNMLITVSTDQSYIGSNSLKFYANSIAAQYIILPIYSSGLTCVNVSFWQYIDTLAGNGNWHYYITGYLVV
jgi:hypothetical protein